MQSSLDFFVCWYFIESIMPCIWTRCSGPPAEKQAHNIKDPAVHLTVAIGYFLSLFVLNPAGEFAAKKLFSLFHLTIKASVFWSWNPPEQHVVMYMLFDFFSGFLTLICTILQLWSLDSLWHLKLSSSPCIRTVTTGCRIRIRTV